MGQAKNEMMRQDDLVAQATDIAIRAGRLRACDAHGTAYRGSIAREAGAYGAVTNAWKAGELDGTLEEARDAMKQALSEAPETCYECDHYFAQD